VCEIAKPKGSLMKRFTVAKLFVAQMYVPWRCCICNVANIPQPVYPQALWWTTQICLVCIFFFRSKQFPFLSLTGCFVVVPLYSHVVCFLSSFSGCCNLVLFSEARLFTLQEMYIPKSGVRDLFSVNQLRHNFSPRCNCLHLITNGNLLLRIGLG